MTDIEKLLHSILDKYGSVIIHKGEPVKYTDSQEKKIVFSVIVMDEKNNRRSCTTSDLPTSLKGIMVEFDEEA